MGGHSIRGMVHRPRLGPLQVPKIPGTNHRWDPCLQPLKTVPTTQSYPYWNTKGWIHKDSLRPHGGSQMITGPQEKRSSISHTSTKTIDNVFQRYSRNISWNDTAPSPNLHKYNATKRTPCHATQTSTSHTSQHPRTHTGPLQNQKTKTSMSE